MLGAVLGACSSGALRTTAGVAWAGCECLPGGRALLWPALTSSSPDHVKQDGLAPLTTTERPGASRDVSQKPYTIGFFIEVRTRARGLSSGLAGVVGTSPSVTNTALSNLTV